MNIIYPILASILVSLVSILAALPFLKKKKISDKLLLFLLSMSVGAILGAIFLDFLPESISQGYTLGVALNIMFGFLFMFIIEKFVHHHHSKKCEHHDHGHSHAYTLAPMNIIGEIIHNFIDGLVIAGAFAANLTLGISATISILLHELPQEIADMGVLLYSGMSKRKALLYNFFSAITALFGTIVGILLIDSIESFNSLIIPFATGNFLYIAASNLVPQLHRDCKLSDTFIHIFAIVFGISIIVLLILYGPAHGHG